ncbi:hypothetical protein Cni_G00409 [Canna indica]|uniref:Uncharacterized protein n=1 Tax=Canna indica TaxID=4628 RepID=A0AAQ3PX50_9LILI|nr:hypothetical protein Cni_G00409 [Canna indica]
MMDSPRGNALRSNGFDHPNESTLEGNVLLLLKLTQDHANAGGGCKPQCINGMMTVLDDLKSRVQKLHAQPRRMAELRRCNTELRRGAPPGDKKLHDPLAVAEDAQNLRQELFSTMHARRNLERMFSSLGKEKELIASELARRVRELAEAEELVQDLRAQNETLLERLKACAGGGESHPASSVLQERNKALSEQLLKLLDGCRAMKRRLKEAGEEKARVFAAAAEAADTAAAGAEVVRGLREKMDAGEGVEKVGMEEMKVLEQLLVALQAKLGRVNLVPIKSN